MSLEILIGNLFLGPFTLLISYIITKHPPKKINHLYGYRTKRSMRNQETWVFANRHSNQLLSKAALLTCTVQVISILITNEETALLIGAIVLVTTLIYSVFLTEKTLKNRFDKERNRL